MIIHISVIGVLLIAAFYAGSAAMLCRIGRSIRSAWLRRLVVPLVGAFLLVLPWSEELRTAWKFKAACENAGLVAPRKVQVDGFLDRSRGVFAGNAREGAIAKPGAIQAFDRVGYRFIEYPIANGKVLHEERTNEGLKVTILERPEARYAYRVDFGRTGTGRRVLCVDESVVELKSERVIATYRRCGRLADTFAFDADPIEFCPRVDGWQHEMLYRRILIPPRER